jgi:hypothetical protein
MVELDGVDDWNRHRSKTNSDMKSFIPYSTLCGSLCVRVAVDFQERSSRSLFQVISLLEDKKAFQPIALECYDFVTIKRF